MSWGETHHSAGVRSGPHCMLLTRHIFHVCVCTCVCHAHAAKKSQWCCIVSVARITAWGNNEFLNHNLHVQLCRMGHVDIPLVSDPALCLWCASVHTTSAFSRWRSALIRSLTLRHCGTLCRRSLTLCHRGTLCLLQQQVEERSHSVTDPAPSQHTLQEVTDHAPSRHTLPSPSVFQVYAATAGRFKVSDICIYIYQLVPWWRT